MASGVALSPAQKKAMLEELRLLDVKEKAALDPKFLIHEINAIDKTTGDEFKFNMLNPLEPWYWQSELVDWWMDPIKRKFLILKARQLGITWTACALGLWYLLFKPGTAVLAYSYTEDEAKKLVQKTWVMYRGIPQLLRNHVEVVQPSRAEEPSEWIKVKHRNGKLSTFQALPATKKHGHGETAALVISDEVAYQDYAREIYKASNPSLSHGGRLILISTANGVSNSETGEGNFFHHLYDTKEEKGLEFKFLPWNMHPDRDEEWYSREAMALPVADRNQQYPLNEIDAFLLSGALYFDPDCLEHYRNNLAKPKRKGAFEQKILRLARFHDRDDGIIEIYEMPRPDGQYIMAVDTSTGRAQDFTSADVLDLSSGALVAHLHAKLETPRAAFQVYYLGKLYNQAKIAVERGGGYGEALIMALRDGNNQIPKYTNLYRHVSKTKGSQPISTEYGFPMTGKSRPAALETLKNWLFERRFPWMSQNHMYELGTFVYKDTSPSPRAEDGCNDDCVMSLAMATYIFGEYGQSPVRELKKKTQKRQVYQPGPVRVGG